MKKRLIITTIVTVIISTAKLNAQNWSLTGNSGINPATNFIGNTDNIGLKFRTNNLNRMYIKPSGEVGIGTTTPSAKLDVNGTMKASKLLIGTTTSATGYLVSIGGKLIAEEVRVDLKAAWPDYVFESNYCKLSLEELEQWVNTHKHLPGIPSAGEMKKEGIMVGEMQAMSMEKIEEAMLYIIQLGKENVELKSRIEQLEKEMSALKK